MENPTKPRPARRGLVWLGLLCASLLLTGACAKRSNAVGLHTAEHRLERGYYAAVRYQPFAIAFFRPDGERHVLPYGSTRRWAEEYKPAIERAVRIGRQRGHRIRVLTDDADPPTPAAGPGPD